MGLYLIVEKRKSYEFYGFFFNFSVENKGKKIFAIFVLKLSSEKTKGIFFCFQESIPSRIVLFFFVIRCKCKCNEWMFTEWMNECHCKYKSLAIYRICRIFFFFKNIVFMDYHWENNVSFLFVSFINLTSYIRVIYQVQCQRGEINPWILFCLFCLWSKDLKRPFFSTDDWLMMLTRHGQKCSSHHPSSLMMMQ